VHSNHFVITLQQQTSGINDFPNHSDSRSQVFSIGNFFIACNTVKALLANIPNKQAACFFLTGPHTFAARSLKTPAC